ncbi:MAG: META domain-containing protein [Methylococcaceae bacterium]|nr:META domain-containing protein [Methylococcaceae bacterium]
MRLSVNPCFPRQRFQFPSWALLLPALVCSACSSTPPPPATRLKLAVIKKHHPEPLDVESEPFEREIDESSSLRRINLPITGVSWEWQGILTPGHADLLDQPGEYRLELKPNGWFEVKADCKQGAGMFEVKGQRIVLSVLKLSHAHCQRGSRADDFLHTLEAVRSFSMAENKLYFEMQRESKTMIFGLRQ